MSKANPKVYSRKLNVEQNAALERYEALTGMPPFSIEDFEAGEITPYQLWRAQTAWLEGVLADVVNINFPCDADDNKAAWKD